MRATDVNTNYNALVARLERRLSGGLSFAAGYTYGKSSTRLRASTAPTRPRTITISEPSMAFRISTCGSASHFRRVADAFRRGPLGAQGVASHILGPWQLANILTLQTGQPLTAVLPTALSGTDSNGTDRPDLVANPNLPGSQRNPNHWFNTSAFVTPPIFYDAQGAYSIPGNEGRNVITGPGLASWDAGLERHFRLSERLTTVFRTDFFNLTNHPNFDRPGLIFATSNFGKISSAENSRQIQFSLRLNW